jgi:hypothetical protein
VAQSEFKTDVESCYIVTCQNNNALACGLVRIHIGVTGVCTGYVELEEEETETDH